MAALRTRLSGIFNTKLGSWEKTMLEYLPLGHDREIRLVDLEPGAPDQELHLRIYHSTIGTADSPSFDALSYVWGSQEDPVKISIDVLLTDGSPGGNYELFISQNLATALKHLRYSNSRRTIWADAICINQLDYAERAQQVLMMGDIYRLSRKVVAFLGPQQDDSDYALQSLEKVAHLVEVDYATSIASPSKSNTDDLHWVDMKKNVPFQHRELLALYHLLHRDWFERLWIRQEIGLGGSHSFLRSGNREIHWPDFCKAIYMISRKPLVTDAFDATRHRAFRQRLSQADAVAFYSMRSFRFINLRRQVGWSKCSDPRDRIYGVLSQLRETDRQIGIIPDYRKTVAEVYVDAVQKHVTHYGDLSILSQCELRDSISGSSEALRVPSWIPDWSTPLNSAPIHQVLPSLFNLLPKLALNEDPNVLQAHGIVCQTVYKTVKLEDTSQDSQDYETALKLMKAIHAICKENIVLSAYETQDYALEACCRALWLNNFSERWLPASPQEPFFEDCLSLIKVLAKSGGDDGIENLSSLPNVTQCLSRARAACEGRVLFISNSGLLGLAPESIATGDEVCLIFGCWQPVVLRLVANDTSASSRRYHVVGGCYSHRMMRGEAILGQLSRDLQEVLHANSLMGLKTAGFVDVKTGLMQTEDPRTIPFLQSLVDKGLIDEPSLATLEKVGAAQVLQKAGLKLQWFDLA